MPRPSRVIAASILLAASSVGFFYALNHVLFSSAGFSPIFRYLLTDYDLKSAWISLAICVLAAAWSRPAPILVIIDHLARRPSSIALVMVVACALGSLFIYRNYPLSMDEYAAVFQAKLFASGRLFARFPPEAIDWLVVRGFNGSFLIASADTGKTIEAYWPGFALILALFEFLKISWLCNATLAGLAIWLIYLITKEITHDRRAPGWALLFTLASGVFAANAISLYAMQAHLTLNLLFALLMLKPTAQRVFGAGLAGSLALILHNPLPHLLFAIPWVVNLTLDRSKRASLPLLCLGYAPGFLAAVGWLSMRAGIQLGHPGVSGMHSIVGGAFAWPTEILLNMRMAAGVKMLIWAPPGLFFLAILGWYRNRLNRHVKLLMQSAVLTLAGYLFVPFDQGHGWGYRYFHSAWGTIPILAAFAMTGEYEKQLRLTAFAGASALLSLAILLPLQIGQIHEFIAQHLEQIPKAHEPGNNIYFIRPNAGSYVADMVQIDPLLRDRNLLLVSRGAPMDTQLILQNWPNATKIFSDKICEQWYLGPSDERMPTSGSNLKQFVFKKIPSLPSAEGR